MSEEEVDKPSEKDNINNILELSEDANLIKSRLLDKLVDENKKVLQTLHRVNTKCKTQLDSVKKNAAIVMERLVTDNAWYKDQNCQLQNRLELYLQQDKSAKTNILRVTTERDNAYQEKRLLNRQIDTLREAKNNLEFQTNHLGSAFLSLREAVITFISNPLALEAQATEYDWDSRIQSPDFKSAVIASIQGTATLKRTLEAIDGKLVQLCLLDPLNAVPVRKGNVTETLTLMGEKLVPYKDVLELKKERQMWQRRYFKQQADVTRLKIEKETLVESIKSKDALIQKIQSDRKFSSFTTNGNEKAFYHNLKSKNDQLKKELKDLKEKYSTLVVECKTLRKKNLMHPYNASANVISKSPLETRNKERPSPRGPKHPITSTTNTSEEDKTLNRKNPTPTLKKLLGLTTDKLGVGEPVSQASKARHVSPVTSPSFSSVMELSKKKRSDDLPHSKKTFVPNSVTHQKSQDALAHSKSYRKLGTTIQQCEYQTPLARELTGIAKSLKISNPNVPVPQTELRRIGTNFLSNTLSPHKDSQMHSNLKHLQPVYNIYQKKPRDTVSPSESSLFLNTPTSSAQNTTVLRLHQNGSSIDTPLDTNCLSVNTSQKLNEGVQLQPHIKNHPTTAQSSSSQVTYTGYIPMRQSETSLSSNQVLSSVQNNIKKHEKGGSSFFLTKNSIIHKPQFENEKLFSSPSEFTPLNTLSDKLISKEKHLITNDPQQDNLIQKERNSNAPTLPQSLQSKKINNSPSRSSSYLNEDHQLDQFKSASNFLTSHQYGRSFSGLHTAYEIVKQRKKLFCHNSTSTPSESSSLDSVLSMDVFDESTYCNADDLCVSKEIDRILNNSSQTEPLVSKDLKLVSLLLRSQNITTVSIK